MWATIEDAARAKEWVEAIALDILMHYQIRTTSLEGKAIVVCMGSRSFIEL